METTIKFPEYGQDVDMSDINLEDQHIAISDVIYYLKNDGITVTELNVNDVETLTHSLERLFAIHPKDNGRMKIHPRTGRYMYLNLDNKVVNF